MTNNEPLTTRTHTFYNRKEIQRSYNYIVYFSNLNNSGLFPKDMINDGLIDVYATSVELPAGYDFKKEYFNAGPFMKSFPVLDHNGFEFTIKCVEDDRGTIKSMIEALNKRIINDSGYYNSYDKMVIPEIEVHIFRNDGTTISKVKFENCYLLKSSVPTFSYTTSDKIEYEITFNADHFHTSDGPGKRRR